MVTITVTKAQTNEVGDVKERGTEVGADGGSFKCSIVGATRYTPEGGNQCS
jgi:hypothetical protein